MSEAKFKVGDTVQYIENNHFYTVEKKNTEYFLTSPDHTSGFWANEKKLRKIVADKANTQNDSADTPDIKDKSVVKFKTGDIVKVILRDDSNAGEEGRVINCGYGSYIVEFLNPYRREHYSGFSLALWYRWENGWAVTAGGVKLEGLD